MGRLAGCGVCRTGAVGWPAPYGGVGLRRAGPLFCGSRAESSRWPMYLCVVRQMSERVSAAAAVWLDPAPAVSEAPAGQGLARGVPLVSAGVGVAGIGGFGTKPGLNSKAHSAL